MNFNISNKTEKPFSIKGCAKQAETRSFKGVFEKIWGDSGGPITTQIRKTEKKFIFDGGGRGGGEH